MSPPAQQRAEKNPKITEVCFALTLAPLNAAQTAQRAVPTKNSDEMRPGRDSALRCPPRVQRRNKSDDALYSFRPLNADGDAAKRRPYRLGALSRCAQE